MLVSLVALALCSGSPAIPSLLSSSAADVQTRWEEAKTFAVPAEQQAYLERVFLRRRVCRDMMDIRSLVADPSIPLRLRDHWRERVYARPELYALIGHALSRFGADYPNVVITAGDISQVGCGQIRYGTVVRHVLSRVSHLWRQESVWDAGQLLWRRPIDPMSYMAEWPRFADEGLGPLWEERRLVGASAQGFDRWEIQRFGAGRTLSYESLSRLMERTQERLLDSAHVAWDRVWHTVEGKRIRIRRARWRDAKKKRQIEVLFRKKVRPRRLRLRHLIRVREARLDIRKPTSPKYEERYDVVLDGEAGSQVIRSLLKYEAHHSSHLGGLDADLSFVTVGNEGHFAPKIAVVDPEGTWAWFKSLERSARELGIPLKAMFVDRSIIRTLRAGSGASRKDSLWRKLRASPGHDSHVHLRIGRSSRWSPKQATRMVERLQGGLPN
ncbi:MAG: hypothetical protein VX223_15520 [Myxococcota bacterium]|nr:hypothetical protein [Myxococcota bacterium]